MKTETEVGRFEIKYAIPVTLRDRILDVIADDVVPDAHAQPLGQGRMGYQVHSLYFDTAMLTDYFERLDRRSVRNRLRVRTYGAEPVGQPVFLENKRKSGKWVVKHRVQVCGAEEWQNCLHERPWAAFAKDIEGRAGFAAHSFCSLVDDHGRTPITVVHYEREVFTPKRDDDFKARLTLDFGVSATMSNETTSLYAAPDISLLPDDLMVMELKYERRAPAWMKKLSRQLRLRATPVSKFGLSVAKGLRGDRPHELRCLQPRLSVAA